MSREKFNKETKEEFQTSFIGFFKDLKILSELPILQNSLLNFKFQMNSKWMKKFEKHWQFIKIYKLSSQLHIKMLKCCDQNQ